MEKPEEDASAKHSLIEQFDHEEQVVISNRTLRQLNRRTKWIFGGMGALAVLMLVTLIVVISKTPTKETVAPTPPTPPISPPNLVDPVLADLAMGMFSAMNPTVDPCVDFFQYSCGGWIQKTPIPDDRPSFTKSFDTIFEDNQYTLRKILEDDWPIIGTFYSNCMDTPTIEQRLASPIQPLLTVVDEINSVDTLFSTMAVLHNLSVSGFFYFGVETDMNDPTKYMPTLFQSGIGLPSRDYYFDPSAAQLQTAYKSFVANLLTLIGFSTADASAKADLIFDLEKSLAGVSKSPQDLRDPTALNHPVTLSCSQSLTCGISIVLPWKSYFDARVAVPLNIVNVATPDFVSGLDTIIFNANMDTLKTYLKYKILRAKSNYLSSNFVDTMFSWSQVLSGAKEQAPRWKKCASLTDSLMGDLLGRYFVQEKFPPKSKDQAQKMVQYLETAFVDNLQSLSWMDSDTKTLAKMKLHQISNKIGYPDKWTSYDSVFIEKSKFFENVQTLLTIGNNQQLTKIGQNVDRNEWFMTPATVNAYYNPPSNEIVFPAAILQPPFFNSSFPSWANFGGIGAVIGHEITHGFDDEGSLYNGDGKLSNWWSENSRKAFESKADCVVDQYNGYQVLGDLHVNGRLTLGENLADNGGIRISFMAWQNWVKNFPENFTEEQLAKYFPNLTKEQMFFISFGQIWCSVQTDNYASLLTRTNPHSLAKYRVIGTVSNYEEFWKAFNCPSGSPMHPEHTCRVW